MRKVWFVSVLVLVLAFASLGAAAETQVLYEDQFEGTEFGYNGESEGWGKSDFGTAFWFPNNGFLESGKSDAIQEKFIWLTGDPSWSDVTVSTGWKKVGGQGSGYASVILRAQDNETYYEFRIQTGNVSNQSAEEAAGIPRAEGKTYYRIFKFVDGVPTLLAEVSDNDLLTLPSNQSGAWYDEQVMGFRFEAKGSILSAYIQVNPEQHKLLDTLPGMTSFGANLNGARWVKVLTTQDRELTSGRVGVSHYENETLVDYIKVETESM